MIRETLSCISGYYNSNEFDLDIPKIADAAEIDEEELIEELNILQNNGDIKINDNKITLINIPPKKDENFNNFWKPMETIVWEEGTKIKLDL